MQVVESYNVNDYEVQIVYDDMAENPYKWQDTLGTYVGWTCWGNILDTSSSLQFISTKEEFFRYLVPHNKYKKIKNIILTQQKLLGDDADYSVHEALDDLENEMIEAAVREWAVVLDVDHGYVFTTPDQMVGTREETLRVLESEWKTFTYWREGETYGYIVSKNGEELDSCYGFYGLEAVKDAVQEYLLDA